MCMPPLFAPPRRMAEPTPFLPQFFPPPEISLFLGTSIAITPFGTQEVLLTTTGRKNLTGSFLVTSSLSITLTHPPFSIASLEFALSPDISFAPPLLPLLALGRCYRTWVLTIYQFFHLTLALWSLAPMSVHLPPIFRKLAGMGLMGSRSTALIPFLSMYLLSIKWMPPLKLLALQRGNTAKIQDDIKRVANQKL